MICWEARRDHESLGNYCFPSDCYRDVQGSIRIANKLTYHRYPATYDFADARADAKTVTRTYATPNSQPNASAYPNV